MSNHIAFIGVGNMGNPMAQQLVKAGKQVKVFDVSEYAIKTAKKTGLNVVNSLDDLLSNASTVISMLPEGKHVYELYLGENGILKKISKDCLIIECSTIDIETSLKVGDEAKSLGIKMIDAPVTGGVMGARVGKLNFLVGGRRWRRRCRRDEKSQLILWCGRCGWYRCSGRSIIIIISLHHWRTRWRWWWCDPT